MPHHQLRQVSGSYVALPSYSDCVDTLVLSFVSLSDKRPSYAMCTRVVCCFFLSAWPRACVCVTAGVTVALATVAAVLYVAYRCCAEDEAAGPLACCAVRRAHPFFSVTMFL